ncbi:MAG: GTP pyrophosphokinase family protein [Lachnospiraceae bacterium]|nr:GTP pyrophosphokinase family protein [Lachnospiraceae bacterium]
MKNTPKYGDEIDRWEETMYLYESALKTMTMKAEMMNDEFVHRYRYNPIEHIKSRLKSADSIVRKLKQDGYDVTIENMNTKLSDIAGVRIICSFTSDIYQIAEMIRGQEDITVLYVKDYIRHPKPNGYKSYHMVISLPVYLSDGRKDVKVEVQIRSVGMDFWASLEHKITYKFEGCAPKALLQDLKACADIVDMLDNKMYFLNEAILAIAEEQKRAKEQEECESTEEEAKENEIKVKEAGEKETKEEFREKGTKENGYNEIQDNEIQDNEIQENEIQENKIQENKIQENRTEG